MLHTIRMSKDVICNLSEEIVSSGWVVGCGLQVASRVMTPGRAHFQQRPCADQLPRHVAKEMVRLP